MSDIQLPEQQPLQGKVVVVGVCGGIAAYKVVEVVRRLARMGADVHVVMTRSATEFVGPLTFRELSYNPVITDLFEEAPPHVMTHITLARRADLLLVAPATAHTLGRFANGLADDSLSAIYLATRAPVLLAPAMNANMFAHPAVQANLARLQERGCQVVGPEAGPLATGHEGLGRMSEPEAIVEAAVRVLMAGGRVADLAGRRILVTAGPTREPIDPVRFLTNRSSGRMGYALAEAARDRGAGVVLVSGPTALTPPAGVEMVAVETAAQMREAVLQRLPQVDALIMAAAVADFRPVRFSPHKIKKGAPAAESTPALVLELEQTADILSEAEARRRPGQLVVGFAAESERLLEHARGKLDRKRLDLIVANDVTRPGAGFGTETNAVTVIRRDGTVRELPLAPKRQVADWILDEMAALWGPPA